MNTNVELLCRDEVYAIVGAAMEVHRTLGAGFAEVVYQEAMEVELRLRGIPYERQKRMSILYKGVTLNSEYVADLVCFGTVIVELKAIRELANRDETQVINYLRATGLRVGLVINFGDPARLDWHRFVVGPPPLHSSPLRAICGKEPPMTTLITNARVITATDDYTADVYIDGETIHTIGRSLPHKADKTIDATGKLLIPGGIDPHVHMELPFGGTVSSDSFETGTRAAAFGGTTSIIDFAIQFKGKTFQQTIDDWHAKAAGHCAIDYSYHLAVTEYRDEHRAEFRKVIEQGITTFKLFLAYPGVFMVDDQTMFRVMRSAGEAGGLTLVHAENGDAIQLKIQELLAAGKTEPRYHAQSRPPVMQADGTARALRVAEFAKSPVFIVHVSCEASMREIVRARDAGQRAYGETCTQYLFLDETAYDKPNFEGAKYVFTPPLVGKENIEPLWTALNLGYLQEVSTDHCPFNFRVQKELGRGDFTKIPNGGPGVEDRLSLIYDGALQRGWSLNQWVDVCSTASAKLFGLFPRKGTIAVGSDADLVLFDPAIQRTLSATTHHMNCDYSLFEGMTIRGKPTTVLSRGKVIIENDRYVGAKSDGNFLKRGPTIGV